MESRCAICGNRTEDMDLATVEFEGVSVKACPYCRKQLSQFLQDPARNAAWLSGVLRVDEKTYPHAGGNRRTHAPRLSKRYCAAGAGKR